MTPEQQRIAIAEFCGWKFHPLTEHLYTDDEKAVAIMCWVRPGNDSWHIECVPDYLNDLNAIHEAEKLLASKKLDEDYYFAIDRNPFATAAQRAEALLKTIGKWEATK